MLEDSRDLIDYFQQRNAITLLMALYHLPDPHWGAVKKYCLKELKTVSLSYHSYRKLCKQLVEIGLAEPIERNTYARDYRLTLYGHQTAGIIEEVLKKVNECKTHYIKTPEHTRR